MSERAVTLRAVRAALAAFTALASLSCASPTESSPPVALEIVQPAAGAVSGAPFSTQPIIHVVDANGRRVRSGMHSVTMTVAGGGSAILGTTTIGSTEGIAAFWDVGLTGLAGVTYSVTFTAAGLEMALQSIIATPGAAVELVVVTPGAGAANGSAFAIQPVVEVRDAQGSRRVQDDATVVTATVASGTLTGVVTATAVDGRATFTSLGLNGLIGGYTLSFESPSLEPAAQELELAIGPPVSLVVAREARDVVGGAPFTEQPRIGFRDAGDNELSTVTGVVVTLGVGGGATTTGTATAAASGGIAAFSDVGITGAGGQSYQLTYSAPGLASAAHSAHLGTKNWGVISSGDFSACGIASGGVTHCWQSATNGPPTALAGAPAFVSLSLDHWRKCGRLANNEAWCWEVPTSLGGSTVQLSLVPEPVPGGHLFSDVDAALNRACGIDLAGAAWCWGENVHSSLGDGTTTPSETPVSVLGGHDFESISSSGYHACGLKSTGEAFCWGANFAGNLGDGTTVNRSSPVAVAGGYQFTSIEGGGGGMTCGITAASATLCWGLTANLGIGGGEELTTPIPTLVSGGHVFTSISAGQTSACGLTAAGEAWCWGGNQYGEIGDGTTDHALVPKPALAGRAFSSISVGNSSSCGRLTSGAVLCWGYGYTKFVADPPGRLPSAPVAIVRP